MNVVSIANAPHYLWAKVCDGWRLVDDQDLTVIQEKMPPGTEEIPHLHQHARQFFFVLSGQLTIVVAGSSFLVGPSQGLEIPPKTAHHVKNDSETETHFLVVSAPSSKSDRIPITPPIQNPPPQ